MAEENEEDLVLIGDIHLRPKSIKDFSLLEKISLDYIKLKSPTRVVFLGDLLDTNDIVKISIYNRLLKFFEKILEISKIVILIGNHDYSNSSQFLTEAHIFNPLKKWRGVTVVDKPIFLGKNLYVPNVPDGRFMEAISEVDWKRAENIFCHQSFKEIVFFGKDSWKKNYPQIISGHIHSYSQKENILYTGSSLQVSIDENPDKYLWYVSGPRIIKKSLGIPGRKKVKMTLGEFQKFSPEGKNACHTYHITLQGSREDFSRLEKTEKYLEIQKSHFINWVFVNKKKRVEKYGRSFSEILDSLLTKQELEYKKNVLSKDYFLMEE